AEPGAKEAEGAAIPQPVAQSGGKSRVTPKGPAGVDIEPAGQRDAGCQLCDRDGTQKGIYPAGSPDGHYQPSVTQFAGDVARRAQNSRPYRVPDHDGEPKTHTQDSEQRAFLDCMQL